MTPRSATFWNTAEIAKKTHQEIPKQGNTLRDDVSQNSMAIALAVGNDSPEMQSLAQKIPTTTTLNQDLDLNTKIREDAHENFEKSQKSLLPLIDVDIRKLTGRETKPNGR